MERQSFRASGAQLIARWVKGYRRMVEIAPLLYRSVFLDCSERRRKAGFRIVTCCPLDGGIAQLGEHELCKLGVTGSIPVASTSVPRDGMELRNECSGFDLRDCFQGRVAQLVRARP